jgi:hypothetical protein
MANKEKEYKDFTRVAVSNTFDFNIVRADSFSVKFDVPEGFTKNIRIDQVGDKLSIDHSHHISWMFRLARPKVTITMPLIKELRLTGSVSGEVTGFKSSEDFSMEMEGASQAKISLQAGKADFHLRGACTLEAIGAAESLIIDVNGACHLEMKDFVTMNAAVRLNGASTCTANITGRLDARLGGVSNLYLIGEPAIGDIRTSGVSKISKYS